MDHFNKVSRAVLADQSDARQVVKIFGRNFGKDRFYYFLAPAIFLLILEFFISESKSRLFTRLNRKLGLE